MSGSVDRLTEVLRVGLRLRTDLDAMSTGARLGPEGQIVSISPQEKALLNHFCPNEEDVPLDPPELRRMWRKLHGDKTKDGPGWSPLPAPQSAPEPGAASSSTADANMDESSDGEEGAPLSKRKQPMKKGPEQPKRPRFVPDDDSDDDEVDVDPDGSDDDAPDPRAKAGWEAAYKARQAREEAKRAKAAAEAAAAEAAARDKAERAALVERYRLAEEAARARAEAEAKAKAAEEAAAAAKAAEEGEGEGEEEEEIVELDEPEIAQNTVTVQEAWYEFKRAYDYVTKADAQAWLTNLTDAQADAMFPVVSEFKDAVAKGDKIKGTIRVGFFRIQKKEISGPMLKAMPSCTSLLRRQQHFLFCEPDALQAGANKFSELFKTINRPEQWSLSKTAPRGFTGHAHKAQWQNCGGRGKGVYFFNCTFVTHKPEGRRAPGEDPNCRLEKVLPNWVLCYRWHKAAEIANAALAARFDGVSPTIAKINGPQDKTLGAIGYDTPLAVPDWAKALFPKAISWSDSNFPSIVEEQRSGGLERRIRFGRGGQSCKTAAAVLSKVVELNPDTAPGYKAFSQIYAIQLTKQAPGTVTAFMADDTKTVGLASWSTHARTVYKDIEAKTIVVYDPWKQSVRPPEWFTQPIEAAGYRVEFVAREAEQAQEGSCQLQATMRVLIGAVYGREGIEASIVAVTNGVFANPHLQIFPVITQMLYSKFKPKAEKSRTFRRR